MRRRGLQALSAAKIFRGKPDAGSDLAESFVEGGLVGVGANGLSLMRLGSVR